MSELADQLRTCPNCGQQNAMHSLKCIRCGEVLEDLFVFDDIDADGQEPTPESISGVLASLNENDLLTDQTETESSDTTESQPIEGDEEGRSGDASQTPDWLERVRERTRKEDPSGEMVKGGQAMDKRRAAGERSQVDQAFDEVIQRIREQSEKERKKTRKMETNLVDEDGVPEWLRRIRELHPAHEQDAKQVLTGSQDENFDDEWTDEELQELLRREIGDEYNPGEQTVFTNLTSSNNPEIAEDQSEEESESLPKYEIPRDFHNIPDDDFDEPDNTKPTKPGNPELLDKNEDPPETDNEGPDIEAEPETGMEVQNLLETPPDFEDEESEQPEEEENEEKFSITESDQIENELEEHADELLLEREESEQAEDREKKSLKPLSTEEQVVPDLLLLRDQRDRAQVLTNIIEQEGHRTIPVLHEKNRQSKLGRLILALLLLAGVIISLVLGPGEDLNLPLSQPAGALQEKTAKLQTGDVVLVVLDYQAATSSEIEELAKPVLDALSHQGVSLRFVTSQPVDLWLGEELLPSNDTGFAVKIEFIPGGLLGYLTLTAGSSPDWGMTPIERVVSDGTKLLDETSLVMIISDSPDFVRNWLEQISPWHPDLPTLAISTSLSEALILPYFESGQLSGFLAGHPGGEGQNQQANQRAWQVGMLIMMVVLILGMITKAEADAAVKDEGHNHA